MTRTKEQQHQAKAEALRAIKTLRHLTGNNPLVADIQHLLEAVEV